jgi:hypothetical protein
MTGRGEEAVSAAVRIDEPVVISTDPGIRSLTTWHAPYGTIKTVDVKVQQLHRIYVQHDALHRIRQPVRASVSSASPYLMWLIVCYVVEHPFTNNARAIREPVCRGKKLEE